jgi:hypothetical protein
MAVSSAGLRPKSDCYGKAQNQLYSKLQARPLVREGATKQQTRNCLKKISRRKKNWSRVTDGCPTPRQAGRLTVGRKFNFNLVSYCDNCYGSAVGCFCENLVAETRDSSVTQKKKNSRRWKPLSSNVVYDAVY